MKRLEVLIFGILIVILVVEGARNQKQKTKPKTKENQSVKRPRDAKALACVSQIQPNEEEEESFFRKEIPETDNGKCLLACYLESRGVIHGGKFSSAGANKIAAQAYPKNAVKTGHVRHILTHCGTIASRETERCQMAYKLADCTTTLSDKFKL